ncbi:MAG TPA: hypothetical protein VMB05_15460 [Solirubrobacteraceae bacterium]|nr:hypothetical protein [Solirubrobacteraceae bacterium]
MLAYTPDLSKGILSDGFGQPGYNPPGKTETRRCGHDEPRLVSSEPPHHQNVFLQGNEDGSHELVNVTEVPGEESDAWFQAASSDLTHVVFTEEAKLTPEAPAGEDLYEWAKGQVRLVTRLPDGTPVAGVLATGYQTLGFEEPGAATFTRAVSSAGTSIVFEAAGDLYSRRNADQPQSTLGPQGECTEPDRACTVQLDASQAGGVGGGGGFMWANGDGSRVFFIDRAPEAEGELGLTSDTVTGSGENLYECHIVEAGSDPRCNLTDLTAAPDARVDGVSGVNATGSLAYFVAEGALPGSGQNGEGAHAEAGLPNLYLSEAGGPPKFIATLATHTDQLDWMAPQYRTTRMSADGQFFAFNSVQRLTGYDNADAATGEPDQEIFLYSTDTARLVCVSCNPDGAPPTAPTRIRMPVPAFFLEEAAPAHMQRNVTEDGRVFFDTSDALLPSATNGLSNVYEFTDGSLTLISSGTGDSVSYLYDVSATGSDVFFVTSQQLVGRDTDQGASLYDAREGGGFPEPSAAPVSCGVETCRGPAAVLGPALEPASSAALETAAAPAPPSTTSVKILTRTVHGSTFRVHVRVPGKGRISISGTGIRTAVRSAATAGTYDIKVTLTASKKRARKHKSKLRLKLHVGFIPAGGSPSTVTALVTVKA